MGRTVTPTFEAEMNADGRVTTEALEITLPLKEGEVEPVTIFVAKREITIGVQTYQNSLRELSEVTFKEDLSIDGGGGAIENASGVWGSVLAETDRSLDGASVVLKKCVRNAAGQWEADKVLPGIFTDIVIDSLKVSFSIVPDLSSESAFIADDDIGDLPEMSDVAREVSGERTIINSGYPEDTRITIGDRRLYGGGSFLIVDNRS
jgi:hypothetical protein